MAIFRSLMGFARKKYVQVAILLLIAYIVVSNSWVKAWICAREGSSANTLLCGSEMSQWNILYHLGGNGPWIPCRSVGTLDHTLPPSCHVSQAHLLSRHAERHPTRNAGSRHIMLLKRLLNSNVRLNRSLAFLYNWSYFTDLTQPAFGNLTRDGPYAGTQQAYDTGTKMNARYGHLVSRSSNTSFWTCSSPRDIETAENFAAGFFGRDWEIDGRAQLHVIPEGTERGADTLTPGDSCGNYQEDKSRGHDYGYHQLAQWQTKFATKISSRLQSDAGGLQLEAIEIYGMMELCGFEILARGSSPWCNVFSHEEWLEFEDARDLLHFYRAGPGNRYAGAMGSLWLDATLRLLLKDIEGVYFSFVHDSDLIAVITALGLFEGSSGAQQLPVDELKQDRLWKTSDITPMGGHMVVEKVICQGSVASTTVPPYVRLLINDARFDLAKLVDSVGVDASGAAMIKHFERYVQGRKDRFGSFSDICGLSKEAPSMITFLE